MCGEGRAVIVGIGAQPLVLRDSLVKGITASQVGWVAPRFSRTQLKILRASDSGPDCLICAMSA